MPHSWRTCPQQMRPLPRTKTPTLFPFSPKKKTGKPAAPPPRRARPILISAATTETKTDKQQQQQRALPGRRAKRARARRRASRNVRRSAGRGIRGGQGTTPGIHLIPKSGSTLILGVRGESRRLKESDIGVVKGAQGKTSYYARRWRETGTPFPKAEGKGRWQAGKEMNEDRLETARGERISAASFSRVQSHFFRFGKVKSGAREEMHSDTASTMESVFFSVMQR